MDLSQQYCGFDPIAQLGRRRWQTAAEDSALQSSFADLSAWPMRQFDPCLGRHTDVAQKCRLVTEPPHVLFVPLVETRCRFSCLVSHVSLRKYNLRHVQCSACTVWARHLASIIQTSAWKFESIRPVLTTNLLDPTEVTCYWLPWPGRNDIPTRSHTTAIHGFIRRSSNPCDVQPEYWYTERLEALQSRTNGRNAGYYQNLHILRSLSQSWFTNVQLECWNLGYPGVDLE